MMEDSEAILWTLQRLKITSDIFKYVSWLHFEMSAFGMWHLSLDFEYTILHVLGYEILCHLWTRAVIGCKTKL